MNPKITLILVVLLALACSAFLLTTRSSRPVNQEEEQDKRDVLVLQEKLADLNINEIKIDHEGGTGGGLHLKREQNRWFVTRPHRFPAKTSAVTDLLSLLNDLKGYEGQTQDIADSPEILLTSTNDHIRIALMQRIGANRSELVIDTDSNPRMYHTQDTLHDFIDRFKTASFYSKKIDVPLITDIERIEFTTPDGPSLLVQQEEQWWIKDLDSYERALTQNVGSQPGITQLFKLLADVELLALQDEYSSLATFGLESPVISVVLGGPNADGTKTDLLEINVGVPADPEDKTRFASINYDNERRPAVFTVATQSALLLGQSATAFRDPRVIATPSTLIASIDLKFADDSSQAIELFSNTKPSLRDSNNHQRELSIESVAMALKELSDACALQYVPAELSKQNELVSVLITPRLGGKREIFTIYSDSKQEQSSPNVLVRRNKEAVALKVPRSAIAALLDPQSLVAKEAE